MSSLQRLVLVRHGESTGNIAWRLADERGHERIEIAERDADVPLSPLGRDQAAALGRRLAGDEPPTAVYASPYDRAVETARIALPGHVVQLDERLRDRELGILDRLTWRGVLARHPEEADRKRHLGKLYYRPPGGESWADVALRLRSALADIERENPGGRVVVVAHDAVVVLARYVIEHLTEREMLEVERTLVANASVTRWDQKGGELRLVTFNDTAHLPSTP